MPAALAFALPYWQWRGRWEHPRTEEAAAPTAPQRRQLLKAAVAAALLLLAFFGGLPRDVSALVVAAALFFSRRIESPALVGAVDWNLLMLFAGLFIVTGAVADLPGVDALFADLSAFGLLPDRLAVLAPLTLLLSSTIGNVPSDILLLQVWPSPPEDALYALALLSTLAGNLLLTGSLANLIVAERAAAVGSALPFGAHARAGIPITPATMAAACLRLWAIGIVPA